MTNSSFARMASGLAISALAVMLVLSIPHRALAWYGGYHYSYTSYPPAPTHYNTPTVQVIYSNGYYQNYFVPAVRYYPAISAPQVPTVYYPPYFQPPVPIYHSW